MKEQADPISVEADTSYPSRPIFLQKVIGGENYMAPADPVGKLEKEIYVMQQTAEKYDPDSYLGQRFHMALGVRQNALSVLETHGGDAKMAIGDLKAERRKAIRASDPQSAENAYLELRILKRMASSIGNNNDPSAIVSRLERSRSYDPEYGERGFLRTLGRSVMEHLIGNPFSETSRPDILTDSLRMAYMGRGGRNRVNQRRKKKLASISERYAH